MKTTERMREIREWYARSDVKFQLIKSLSKREFCLLVPSWADSEARKNSIRMLRCHSVQHFDYITKEGWRIWDKGIPFNMYYSLARYRNGIPIQTFNMEKRDNDAWNKSHFDEMEGFDFMIDIDAGDFDDVMQAHFTASLIIEFFQQHKIPFSARFSGRGFHLIIPYMYFYEHNFSFNPNDENSIYSVYRKIAIKLSEDTSEMIDLGIYDSRRVCKIPFSLSLYEDNIYICYPFQTLLEFDNFNIEDYELSDFNKFIRGYDIKIFNMDGNIKKLLEMIK